MPNQTRPYQRSSRQLVPPLPNPNLIGLPEKYVRWRPGQAEAVVRALESDKRFVVLGLPTGSGKSLTYMATGAMDEDRATMYLTSTKGLQDQLVSDFHIIGLRDIRGMGNYPCKEMNDGQRTLYTGTVGRGSREVRCDEGPCLAGWKCDKSDGGCEYFDSQRAVQSSHLAVTNYAYWMAVGSSDQGRSCPVLGKRGRIVLDEAHAALDELAGHLAIEIGVWELDIIGSDWPSGGIGEWKVWAGRQATELQHGIETLSQSIKEGQINKAALSRLRELKDLHRRMLALSLAKGEWVHEETRDRHGRRCMRLDPVWPADYAEDILFRHTEKVILTSATIRPKTLDLLGIKEDAYEFQEHGSPFPVENRWFNHVPCVRVKYDMDPSYARLWVAKIDQILRGRGDRKGIVHTISYARRDYLLRYSQHKERMVVHDSGGTQDTVRRFKAAGPGAVLVSPSVSTGFDFPMDECRYQIIGKVPFPSTKSIVLQARQKRDPDYFAYVAMQELVQMCGRGVRSVDDWCENFIVDDNVDWFMGKYKKFAPGWFNRSYRPLRGVPEARPMESKQQNKK
jgi:ATP-dependent DNA helicase DinG